MEYLIGEILTMVDKAPTEQEKIDVLRKNSEAYLITFLQHAFFTPKQYWAYAQREMPYIKNENPPYGVSSTNIINELRRIRIWKTNYQIIQKRLDEITIQVLEEFPEYEYQVFAAMISGKPIPCNGLTRELVLKAFPNIVDERTRILVDEFERLQTSREEATKKVANTHVTDEPTKEPKRRGRPKKVSTDEPTPTVKKKRGRPPKNKDIEE